MAREIPSAPKVQTTVYKNFGGVDFTNDASNVWYRRSPNGLNMLPDIDGRPYKRTGWKIELSKSDYLSLIPDYDSTSTYLKGVFCKHDGKAYHCTSKISTPEAWNSAHWEEVYFEQYKVAYFEIGSKDYLACFTSYGVFFYSDSLTYVSEYIEAPLWYRTFTGKYRVGDYCITGSVYSSASYHRCKNAITPPKNFTASDWDDIDADECVRPLTEVPSYDRSFFFEGGGDAGFYFFGHNMLLKFDGTDVWQVRPKEPIVLIGCDNTGAGTMYEGVNLLNEWRCVGYSCDGSVQDFTVPLGYDKSGSVAVGIYRVLVRNPNGSWYAPNTSDTYAWTTPNDGEIHFTNAPQVRVEGEDNLRIYYKPNGSVTTESESFSSSVSIIVRQKHTRQARQIYVLNTSTHKYVWLDYGFVVTGDQYESSGGDVIIKNAKYPLGSNVKPQVKNKNGTFVDTSYLTIQSGGKKGASTSYTNEVRITPKAKSLFNNYTGYKTTTLTTNHYGNNETVPRKSLSIPSGYSSPSALVKTRVAETTTFTTRFYYARVKYTKLSFSNSSSGEANRNAFYASSRAMVFGNGIINQVFLTASGEENYNTRVWYSTATNPAYFPDTNYIEAGATDKPIMGLMRVGEYLGIIKQGAPTESAVYLAYPTSFENETTYAIKQSVNGVGAISNGAFNILEDEPMFLSAEGVMAIEPNETEDRRLRNRSVYINKKLCAEEAISNAVSFVYDGMYWLAIGSNVYVLDGSQKTSWANAKTNLQYEAYYLENVPAKCFAKKNGMLWFIDYEGNLCRFKTEDEDEPLPYVDEYTETDNYSANAPSDSKVAVADILYDKTYIIDDTWDEDVKADFENGDYTVDETDEWKCSEVNGIVLNVVLYDNDHLDAQNNPDPQTLEYEIPLTYTYSGGKIRINGGQVSSIQSMTAGDEANYSLTITYAKHPEVELSTTFNYGGVCYTVVAINGDTATVAQGAPIIARWGTIADDDNATHYYKNLQKKGNVISLLPSKATTTPEDSGVKVYLKKDEKDDILVGNIDAKDYNLPFDFFPRKKMKKYKRLQIICINDTYNDSFGVDQIIKSYVVGNYAKR